MTIYCKCKECRRNMTPKEIVDSKGEYCATCFVKELKRRREGHKFIEYRQAAIKVACGIYQYNHNINHVYEAVQQYLLDNGFKYNIISLRVRNIVRDGLAWYEQLRLVEKERNSK